MSKNHAGQTKQESIKTSVKTKVTKHPEEKHRKESIEIIFENKEGGTNESKTIVVEISDEEETNKEIKEEEEQDDTDSQKLLLESSTSEVIQALQNNMKQESESNNDSLKGNEQSDDSGPDDCKVNFNLEEYNPDEANNIESRSNNEIMMVIEQSDPNHKEETHADHQINQNAKYNNPESIEIGILLNDNKIASKGIVINILHINFNIIFHIDEEEIIENEYFNGAYKMESKKTNTSDES